MGHYQSPLHYHHYHHYLAFTITILTSLSFIVTIIVTIIEFTFLSHPDYFSFALSPLLSLSFIFLRTVHDNSDKQLYISLSFLPTFQVFLIYITTHTVLLAFLPHNLTFTCLHSLIPLQLMLGGNQGGGRSRPLVRFCNSLP